MRGIKPPAITGIDRRTFLVATGALVTRVAAQGVPVETFTQWLAVSERARPAMLSRSIDRIGLVDREIHAWVQVSPQEPTGHGPLDGIPFGVKDIMETKGLATEY